MDNQLLIIGIFYVKDRIQRINNIEEFEDALRIFPTNEEVLTYNLDKLRLIGNPIAAINAINSDSIAKKASQNDLLGLENVIFLTVGARVMLTLNLWQEV